MKESVVKINVLLACRSNLCQHVCEVCYAKVFASSEDEAELQHIENLRARDAEINNLNTGRRYMGK